MADIENSETNATEGIERMYVKDSNNNWVTPSAVWVKQGDQWIQAIKVWVKTNNGWI